MKHKHSRMIAITVSSILGTALSLAYAGGQPPAVTPSSDNQQQPEQTPPVNPRRNQRLGADTGPGNQR